MVEGGDDGDAIDGSVRAEAVDVDRWSEVNWSGKGAEVLANRRVRKTAEEKGGSEGEWAGLKHCRERFAEGE